VIQLTGQFVPVKVNADKEGKDVARKYAVRGFPTILFVNAANGEVEGKIGGYMPPAGFSAELKRIAAAHKALPALRARHRSNPKDPEAAARLAAIAASQGKEAEASALLTQAETSDPANRSGHLARAYNAVADLYQEKRQFDKAIPLFKKAAKTGKTPQEIAYAHLSIAVCHLSQNDPSAAVPALEATLAVPNVPADMKAQAQQMLDQVKQRGGGDRPGEGNGGGA